MNCGWAVFALVCGPTFGQVGQGPVAFEVASVRRVVTDEVALGGGPRYPAPRLNGGPGAANPERITYRTVSIKRVLTVAYDLKDFQISGPSSIDEDRYDIDANLPPATTPDEFRLMLQNLLAERFNLRVHLETKDLPVFELVIAKNGSKLTPSAPLPPDAPAPPSLANGEPVPLQFPPTGGMRISGGLERHMIAEKRPLAKLIEFFEPLLAAPIIDKTGLTGTYDFTMDFSEDGLPRRSGTVFRISSTGEATSVPPEDLPPSNAPNLFSALEKQLGLKLEAKKGPVTILVVDHADRVPREN